MCWLQPSSYCYVPLDASLGQHADVLLAQYQAVLIDLVHVLNLRDLCIHSTVILSVGCGSS